MFHYLWFALFQIKSPIQFLSLFLSLCYFYLWLPSGFSPWLWFSSSLTMMSKCALVCFSWLVFSGLLGFVVCYLPLILKNTFPLSLLILFLPHYLSLFLYLKLQLQVYYCLTVLLFSLTVFYFE